jgi:hypothetical protein
MNQPPLLAWKLGAVALFITVLAACDGASQSLIDLVHKPSATEMADRVDRLVAEGKTSEALREGEDWLKVNPDPDGVLHRRLAEIHVHSREPDAAVGHLVRVPEPVSHAASEQGAAGVVATPDAPRVPAHAVEAATPGATARAGVDGVEARAGDARANAAR